MIFTLHSSNNNLNRQISIERWGLSSGFYYVGGSLFKDWSPKWGGTVVSSTLYHKSKTLFIRKVMDVTY